MRRGRGFGRVALALALFSCGSAQAQHTGQAPSGVPADGACLYSSADPLEACSPVPDMAGLVSAHGDPLIRELRRMTLGAQIQMAEDGARLSAAVGALSDEELLARFVALPAELAQLERSVCHPRRIINAARVEADCRQVQDTRAFYDSQFRPIFETEGSGSSSSTAETIRDLRARISNASCERHHEGIIGGSRRVELNPECGLGRLLLLQALPPRDRDRLWGILYFRHTTDSGDHVANNGYSLEGGRRGAEAVGHTADCSEYACRGLTGESSPHCPTTHDYLHIGRYLAHGGARPRWGDPAWSGLEECFERVPVQDGAFPMPGDIIVYPGHMVFVNGFTPETSTVQTIEATSTRFGIGTRERVLRAFPRPEVCRSASATARDPIPADNTHVLRVKADLPGSCPRDVRQRMGNLH